MVMAKEMAIYSHIRCVTSCDNGNKDTTPHIPRMGTESLLHSSSTIITYKGDPRCDAGVDEQVNG